MSSGQLGGPRRVQLVEVGPRDGLQNETRSLPLETKLGLIERLADAGHTVIEATAYVSPRAIPQMGDHRELMRALRRRPGVRYPVLVPNLQGLEAALEDGVRDIAVFTAATDAFNLRNIRCTTRESLQRFEPVAQRALREGLRLRGYVSCVIACPYSGAVEPRAVADVAAALRDLGCGEISLGDTIGVGTPATVLSMLEAVSSRMPMSALAGHFHDTRGQAVANVFACWQAGMTTFDASIGGLGGCPYAPGASGNVATERVAYLFAGLGVETGVDAARLSDAASYVLAALGRDPAASPIAKGS